MTQVVKDLSFFLEKLNYKSEGKIDSFTNSF